MKSFEQIFGIAPVVSASAHGRVNMLGEHTDYNDGFVLPTAIPQQTTVQIAPARDSWHHFYAADLEQIWSGPADSKDVTGFARYLLGCARTAQELLGPLPPLMVCIESEVPIGVGLSSSAALEIATLRALRDLCGWDVDELTLARLGQRAEREHTGVACGIMDQMACALAEPDHMLFLDTRSLESRLIPFPEGSEALVIDSGLPRRLASSAYNERRRSCEAAAAQLEVAALRDVSSEVDLSGLSGTVLRRAHHVVTENARVIEAARGVSAEAFGRLMNASHESLRMDFEVSVDALDILVEVMRATDGVFGARLTGAGFGGACVALIRSGEAHRIGTRVLEGFARSGYRGEVLVTREQ